MKFVGKVGFWASEVEVSPGVYRSKIIEKDYTGNVYKNTRMFQGGEDRQNDNLVPSNQVSIISDLYARDNWNSIRYVVWNGVKWKVTNVDVGFPRLTLTIGGVYNGTNSETAT